MKVEPLVAENAALRERVRQLEEQLAFLVNHKTLAAGIAGEALISKIVDGKVTSYAESFDVIDKSGRRIEVKYARLNKAIQNSDTKRWAWGKIFGESGGKDFDYMILVGEKDERWNDFYKDKISPFVIFCVPKNKLLPLTMPMNGGRYRAIQLTSNPESAKKSRAAILFKDHQMTAKDLADMFAL